ncbi:MAG: peptidase M1 [Saprospiraceae bacterium]|nr:MAG: peptidase M1 [Saprospiraceae bacterium]
MSPLLAQPDFYQHHIFSRADTLRGMLSPERSCYDVTFYALNVRINPDRRYLEGYVDIEYRVKETFNRLQIDLYANMDIDRILFEKEELKYTREFDAVFVDFPRRQKAGSTGKIRVYYQGNPRVAINPPWDGGFVWTTDKADKAWIGVACEGDGASLWWPNKDHLSDEPDSMAISISIPNGLMAVANGELRQIVPQGDYQRYDWFVAYPINNYNVTVNIADYIHFSEMYHSFEGDAMNLDYYVLRENEAKARKHFQQVPKVLACFERYFGKYPFWKDGYGLVETPYLGMEHQGAIAYGNKYMRGYLGSMIPRDMDWDYIIVHETGHEYFGNSISCNDLSEMWIHESFTTYMEALYVECVYSYKDAVRYLQGQRVFIANKEPILGPMNVNWEDWEGSDHYYKGAWILHTLRNAINDDAKWFDLLHGFYEQYALSNVTTDNFVDYVNTCTGKDWTAFFDQYLKYPGLPTLEYRLESDKDQLKVHYRWMADVPNFLMPVLIGGVGDYTRVTPVVKEWQEVTLKGVKAKDFKIAKEFFLVKSRRID